MALKERTAAEEFAYLDGVVGVVHDWQSEDAEEIITKVAHAMKIKGFSLQETAIWVRAIVEAMQEEFKAQQLEQSSEEVIEENIS